jgi:hypothetical protein
MIEACDATVAMIVDSKGESPGAQTIQPLAGRMQPRFRGEGQ